MRKSSLGTCAKYLGGDSGNEATTKRMKRLACKIQKLDDHEAAAVEAKPDVRIIDAQLLGRDELSYQTGEPAMIYLRAGGSVLRIVLTKIV